MLLLVFLFVFLVSVCGDTIVLFNGTSTTVVGDFSGFVESNVSLIVNLGTPELYVDSFDDAVGLEGFITSENFDNETFYRGNDIGFSFVANSDGTVKCFAESGHTLYCSSVVCDWTTFEYSKDKFVCRVNGTNSFSFWGSDLDIVEHADASSVSLGVGKYYTVQYVNNSIGLFHIDSGMVSMFPSGTSSMTSSSYTFLYHYSTRNLTIVEETRTRLVPNVLNYKVFDDELVLTYTNDSTVVKDMVFEQPILNILWDSSGDVGYIHYFNRTVVGAGGVFDDVKRMLQCGGYYAIHRTNLTTVIEISSGDQWDIDTIVQNGCLVFTGGTSNVWITYNTSALNVAADDVIFTTKFGFVVNKDADIDEGVIQNATNAPTLSPVVLTFAPSGSPTKFPTRSPTAPTAEPTIMTDAPSASPSVDVGNSPGLVPTPEPFDPDTVKSSPTTTPYLVIIIVCVVLMVGTVGVLSRFAPRR